MPPPIERIRVRVLEAPLAEPVPMSFGQLTHRQVCLLEVEAGGLTGIGESWINYPAWGAAERVATLCEGVAPLLLSVPETDPRLVAERLAGTLLPVGRQWGALGPLWQAISAVDLALWDLLGKANGVSVARLLAGPDAKLRDRVPAYASGIGPTDVEGLCATVTEAGFAAAKVKLGFEETVDKATLKSARATLPPGCELFADSNQAWDLETALQRVDMMVDSEVAWLEEPIAGNDLILLRRLAQQTSIPLATGENLYGIDSFQRYVESDAIRIIQPDLAKSGGISVAARVAEHAAVNDTWVAPHCYSSGVGVTAMMHLAAALEQVKWLELDVRDNPLRTELFTEPLSLDRGHLVAPSGPGFGVELSPDAIDRYQIHQEERTVHDL